MRNGSIAVLIVSGVILAGAAVILVFALRPGDSSLSSQAYYGRMANPPASAAAWSRAGSTFTWKSTLPENAAFRSLSIFSIRMGNPENRPAHDLAA